MGVARWEWETPDELLLGAGTGDTSLAPMPLEGAPATELGDTANGASAVAQRNETCYFQIKHTPYIYVFAILLIWL